MTRANAIRLIAAAGLFAILLAIALFARDALIRGLLGDVLVVVFLYLLARALVNHKPRPTAAVITACACAVELGQALHLVSALGLEQNTLARTIIGAHADWLDLAAYTGGALLGLLIDSQIDRAAVHPRAGTYKVRE